MAQRRCATSSVAPSLWRRTRDLAHLAHTHIDIMKASALTSQVVVPIGAPTLFWVFHLPRMVSHVRKCALVDEHTAMSNLTLAPVMVGASLVAFRIGAGGARGF